MNTPREPLAWAVVGCDGSVQELLHCPPLDRQDRLDYWDRHAGWDNLAPHKIVALYDLTQEAA